MIKKPGGRIFMFVGVVCAGKNTLVEQAIQKFGLVTTISWTTRERYPSETEGVNYYYRTKDEFEQKISSGFFAEYAQVHGGDYYGTPSEQLNTLLESGRDVIFDIDIQGALQIKAKFPTAYLVFVLPRSLDEVMGRLQKRNRGESNEKIAERLESARREIEQTDRADYFIINEDEKLQEAIDNMNILIACLQSGRRVPLLPFRNLEQVDEIKATFH
jgi:guanylate kinase